MANRIPTLRCPTCKQLVLRSEPEFPFCSERCRLIDLGKWASGAYVISTPLHQADGSGEADYAVNPRRDPSSHKPDGKHDDERKDRR